MVKAAFATLAVCLALTWASPVLAAWGDGGGCGAVGLAGGSQDGDPVGQDSAPAQESPEEDDDRDPDDGHPVDVGDGLNLPGARLRLGPGTLQWAFHVPAGVFRPPC